MASSVDNHLGDTPTLQDAGGPLLSDVMPGGQQLSIFGSFTRDSRVVAERLDNDSSNTTVLAPTDTAIKQLPRRIWEDPQDYNSFGAQAYEGEEGEDRAKKNMEMFVTAHIVPRSPWKANEKVKTLAGNEIWYEKDGDTRVIHPMGVKVLDTVESVANGQIWSLEQVLNPKKSD